MNPFETVSLDQLNDPAKTCQHIGRQGIEFIPNAVVKQLYEPRHQFTLSHFCNVMSEEASESLSDPLRYCRSWA
jgi:hypothetical protein